ncbi:MAG: undecaprenyl-diphosphatase UppP [Fimbriimonadaceae bacterium]|nr:undecaprenyl-diphosphatase UppP [Chthonomonadaceae bacterium]MCO5296555.1 undecaprenyl-diphosphatase UppP [Fimbriimonadaceae bacterium]
MGLIEAIVLGIVQGLTEFLPISSTAHLRILPALLGWSDPGASFTAVIQLGTLGAVLVYFRSELASALGAWGRSLGDASLRKTPEGRLGWAIFWGTIPIVILGVLFKSSIENELRSLEIIAWSLIGMGLLLGVADRVAAGTRGEHEATVRDGVWVGLWQCIALIPGASRSGSTITGALLGGFDRAAAARFSFLLSVPSVFAAGVFSLKEHAGALGGQWMAVAVATAVSFVVGYASIAFLLRYLQTRGLWPFVLYRVALGVAILALLSSGTLRPDTGLPPAEGAVVATGHQP